MSPVRSFFSRERRMGGALIGAALAAALGAAAAAAAAAADDPFLSSLVGDWIGRGKARTSPTAAEEIVYCKIANRLVDSGKTLEQKGRCALATNSGAIKGRITAAGGSIYEGTLDSFSTNGIAKLTGSGKGNTVTLVATFTDRATKRPVSAKITLVSGDGKYRLVTEALDSDGNAAVKTGDIVFERN